MNKIIVIGNIGRDPEMSYTPQGAAVTKFSVASSRKYTTASGEQREETEWFNINAWGKLGERCNQYLTKGQQVYVEGRLQTQRWTTQDGEQRFANSINLSDVHFLSRSQDQEGNPEESDTGEEQDLAF